jgi:hypothetical protein
VNPAGDSTIFIPMGVHVESPAVIFLYEFRKGTE